jgi:type IV secretory pathway VirB10-like protein
MSCLRATQVQPGSQTPPAAPTPTPLGGGGLSGGAIAGIVVGVVVGVALIAGLAFWFWRRRRAQRKPASTEAAAAEHPPAYGDGKEQPLQQPAVAEAPTDTGIKELSPDTEVRPELAETYKPELKRGNTDAPVELPAEAAPNSTQ